MLQVGTFHQSQIGGHYLWMPVMLTRVQFPYFNRSEEPLTLGHWHELHVSRTAKNGILQVDKQKAVEGMAEVRRTSPPDDSCERGYCFLPVLETKAPAQWLITWTLVPVYLD